MSIPLTSRLTSLALAGALTLTGCGGDDSVDEAVCGSKQERTEHLTKETAVDAMRSAAGESITQHVRMEVKSSDRTLVMEGDGDSGVESFTEMDVEMDSGAGRKMRIILIDGIYYLSSASLTPEGKFVKLDPNDPSDRLAAAMKPTLEGTGLSLSFDAWEAALVDVQFESDEVLEDGSEAEKYTFVMDNRTALAIQRPGAPLPSGIPETLVNEVWIDSHNLVRRVEFMLDGARTEMTMSDYCEPIDVEAPDEADIVEQDDLTGQ